MLRRRERGTATSVSTVGSRDYVHALVATDGVTTQVWKRGSFTSLPPKTCPQTCPPLENTTSNTDPEALHVLVISLEKFSLLRKTVHLAATYTNS